MNNNMTDSNIMIKSKIWKLDGIIPPKMVTGFLRTKQILKILLPIILPISKSYSPFFAEIMVVSNSVKDVSLTKMSVLFIRKINSHILKLE
jgi:hypothetical protein